FIEDQVALGEILVTCQGRGPRSAVGFVERGGIECRRDFCVSAKCLATQELMEIEPEAVLEHEHAFGQRFLGAESGRQGECQQKAFHVRLISRRACGLVRLRLTMIKFETQAYKSVDR